MSGAAAPAGVGEAVAAAEAAAGRAGVVIAELDEMADLVEVAELFMAVWQAPRAEAPCQPPLLRALAQSGNYVAGARLSGTLVGAAVGFLHPDGDQVGLHSHISGVAAGVQARGIGYALKLHQRAWALARGLPAVTWTFDPLVRRNAVFNLVKLGAEVVGYLPNFYGAMADGINAGDQTDRCLVRWPLAGGRAVAAAAGAVAEPDLGRLRRAGATALLSEDAAGRPSLEEPGALDRERPWALLVQVPGEIVAMRAADLALASRWRRCVRATMGAALDRGYLATGITRSGWYLLERPELGPGPRPEPGRGPGPGPGPGSDHGGGEPR